MYFESNWSHKKGEKKKKRLGDWTKANKHAVEVVYKFGLLEVVYNFEESFRKTVTYLPWKNPARTAYSL